MTAAVTRTVTIDDLTPQEVAQLFCGFFDCGQAAFFNEVARISATWPGAGWCSQAFAIADNSALTVEARRVIEQLAEHLSPTKEA